MKKYLCGLMVLVSVQAIAQKAKPKTTKPIVAAATKTEFIKPKSDETIVEITTDMGVMKARLYNSTPQHRDNFIKLIKQGFYDSLLFHRVIQGFMIQGGDPTSKHADSTAVLGGGEAPNIPMVPAEFRKVVSV